MEDVVVKYLKELTIPVSSTYCKKLIQSHPDYPSLLFIADTLERWSIRYQTARIRNTPSVFMHLLSQQRKVHITSVGKGLGIGKSDAPITLLMVGSLGCRPCGEGIKKAIQLIQTYPRKVSLRIRFLLSSANNGEVTPDKYLLYYWQKKIYGKGDGSIRTKKLLQTWYELMDLELFKKEYPITLNKNRQEEDRELIDRWEQWFEQVEINKTPTFFMNGYELPKGYRIEELMGLIPGIVEEFPTNEMAEEMRNRSHATHK